MLGRGLIIHRTGGIICYPGFLSKLEPTVLQTSIFCMKTDAQTYVQVKNSHTYI